MLGAGRVDFSKDAAGAESADVVVAVVGEDPYAEGSGDRDQLELSPDDRALLDAAKRSGKPLVVVLLSGRPLILGDLVDRATALVGGLAARNRGRRDRRRAGRRGQADRQAPLQLAARHGADPDQRRRPDRTTPLYPYGFGLSW